ncbi:hypothetical protein OF83DRAFT_1030271, partial [Amylostereum chailletii]
MSSDLVPTGGLSIIQSSLKQKGPRGPRMILGPFRFVNHDCDPNCHVGYIAKRNACTVASLRFIEAGEAITVSYTSSGYHDPDTACRCGMCCSDYPPRLPRPVSSPASLSRMPD